MNGNNKLLDKIDNIISPESKSGLEGLTAILILVFSLIFSHIFIIPLNILANFPNWIVYIGVCTIFYMLKLLLFSSDKLYYGDPNKNKYVKAFQLHWPSKHIAKKFSIPLDDAFYYWYEKLFNTWRNPSHERHCQYVRSLRRGYSCRFVFYSLRFFEVLLWISFPLTLLQLSKEISALKSDKLLFWMNINLGGAIAYILFVLIFYILIRGSNKTNPTNLGGVWRRYDEINKMHIKWIDENIDSIEKLKSP